jgi:hypothetical protein
MRIYTHVLQNTEMLVWGSGDYRVPRVFLGTPIIGSSALLYTELEDGI